jgi:hypothetical protein
LLAGTWYDFKVVAFDAALNLSSAALATQTTPVVTPTLSATLQGSASGNTHTLNWSYASTGVTVNSVEVQVKKDNGAYTTLTTYNSPANTSGTYTNSVLLRGKYTYRIKVVGQGSSTLTVNSNTLVFNVR